MLTTPSVARCQRSLCSSSATETLKLPRSLSFRLRRTWRLSFSECAPSMRSSSVSVAIGTASGNGLSCSGQLGSDLLGCEGLDYIANFDVTVTGDADTALHTVAHFGDIVFEAAQRTDAPLVDHHVVAQQTHIGIALDHAIDHRATSDGSDLGHSEGVADFGAAKVCFLDRRFEQSEHGFLDLVLQLVDDRMQADVNLLLFGEFLRFALGTYVEAD